jgi:peptidoglycan/xylan/chitin deacetylase (PgdA/CDA1 family)
VSLTFDDGYRDNYSEAFPALRARGLPATVFVTAGHLDSGAPFWWDRLAGAVRAAPARDYSLDLGRGPETVRLDDDSSRRRLIDQASARVKMIPHTQACAWLAALVAELGGEPAEDRSVLTWDEAREMAAAGIEIGSHTLDHPILSRLDPAEAVRQVVISRRVIEERIGRPVRFFAYPNGTPADFTPVVERAVRAAGYEAALTTIDGRPRISSDLFRLERVAVSNGMTTDSGGRFSESLFAAEISGLMNALLLRKGSGGTH